jgi:hypothetical protein
MALTARPDQRARASVRAHHYQSGLPMAANEAHQPHGGNSIDREPCSCFRTGTARPNYGRHHLVSNTLESIARTSLDGRRGCCVRVTAAPRLYALLCRDV